MEEIAELAGLTKRTVYNHYDDKDALFVDVVQDVIASAEAFVQDMRRSIPADIAAEDVAVVLEELGRTLAHAIVRPEVVALRRLMIGESRRFRRLAADYYDRAPGQVVEGLSSEFRRLSDAGALRVHDATVAAKQFAYLIAGEPLDRAVLTGTLPSDEEVERGAREGVRTFLARYGHT